MTLPADTNLSSIVNQLREQIAIVEDDVHNYKRDIGSLQKDLDERDADVERLELQIKSLREEVKFAEDERDQALRELSTWARSAGYFEADVIDLEEINSDLAFALSLYRGKPGTPMIINNVEDTYIVIDRSLQERAIKAIRLRDAWLAKKAERNNPHA